ncbi:MAG: hypothetical protein C4547_16705 [Phycisphaerales bacterium]|nr:MAG: hypothetical protein C4547_16705 [Phycisphaerales bacterium]
MQTRWLNWVGLTAVAALAVGANSFADEGTAAGRGPVAQADCFCAKGADGQAHCRRDASCNNPKCVDGRCPDGMTCWVDSCCGDPVCVPDDCQDTQDCREPGACGTFKQCLGEPPAQHCVYEVTKVKNKANRCGKDCDGCPYRPGQRICQPDSCNDLRECRSGIKFTHGCGNGGTCIVKARAVACENCDPGCE